MGFQFEGIGVEHHLAAASAERLRYRGARNAGQLIANHVLRHVLQLGLGETLAAHGQQTDGQAGGIEFEHHGRQCPRRQAAHLRRRQSAHHGHCRIRVHTRMKIDFDDADAGERARLDVFDAAAQRQEPLQAIGDAVLHLLRRHSRIKGRDHHYRYVDPRKHVDSHPGDADSAQNGDDQAGNQDEVRRLDSEFRHLRALSIRVRQFRFHPVAGAQAGSLPGDDQVRFAQLRRQSPRVPRLLRPAAPAQSGPRPLHPPRRRGPTRPCAPGHPRARSVRPSDAPLAARPPHTYRA